MHASLALESGVVKAIAGKWRIGLGWRGETKGTPHPIHWPRKLAPFDATAAAALASIRNLCVSRYELFTPTHTQSEGPAAGRAIKRQE